MSRNPSNNVFTMFAASALIITSLCRQPTASAFTSPVPSTRAFNALNHPSINKRNCSFNTLPRKSTKPAGTSSSSTSLFNGNDNNIFRTITNALDTSYATLIDLLFFGKLPSALPTGMRRVPTQFIAALGGPTSFASKSGAEQWGIWPIDPGPRGVYVKDFQNNPYLGKRNDGKMPAGWKFDPNDFWIEEFGRVMEKPDFPLSPGRYMVTGGREVTTLLTVDPPDSNGYQGWRLEGGQDGVTLYDVTHLPCRSARYCPQKGEEGRRSPADANWGDFPVRPGAEMPPVKGCEKQDYAVLFVVAVEG